MLRSFRILLAVIAGLATMPSVHVASAADLYAGSPGDVGPCSADKYLNRIVERFRYQVRNVPNLPDVEITEFRRIHEHRYLPESEEWPIARRYCGATVDLSDGRSRDIWFLIESKMGFASIGDNVEFCVSGFDRWLVYNGRCRILR